MMDNEETSPTTPKFDFEAFAADTLFIERRNNERRRGRGDAAKARAQSDGATAEEGASAAPRPAPERRAKKERRRRIDPTTFEKQYTDNELEFMNAMQQFKVRTGQSFPTHGDVLRVARSLGYGKVVRTSPAGESTPLPGNPFDPS